MAFRKHAASLLVAGALLPLIAMGSPALASDSSATKAKAEPSGELIAHGVPAVPFTLQDIDGKPVSVEAYAGKNAVLIVFWSFFCGPCREEIPLLDDVLKKYAKDGLEMFAINLDGPKMDKAVRNYMGKGAYSFRVLWEKMEGIRYVTADAYGVSGTPTTVLVGKNGKVIWAHVGRAESPKIEAEVKKALAAQ